MTKMISMRGLASALGALALAALCVPSARAAEPSLLKQLPARLQMLYTGETNLVQPSAYDHFAMPAKPWRWCYSESYQGNPWRVAMTNELKRLVGIYEKKGWIASFEMSNSNGDISRQISQVRAFIDKKCSIIASVPGSVTGLNGAIEAAYKAGIPFVTISASVTSPYAINVDSNYVRWGYDMMRAIGKSLGGKGNIIMVEGIAGAPITAEERAGAEAALKEFPGLKVLRRVNGNWTANVTKTVVLQVLSTTPQKIDAVWTTGSESRVIAEDFAEAGRPAPLITGSISGDALGYWKQHPNRYRFEGNGVLPAWNAQALFRVAVRLLEGQQPRLNEIMIPIPIVHSGDLAKWYSSCMTPASVSVFPVPPEDPMPVTLMNAYFAKPKPIAGYNYADTPDPCAGK